MERDLSHFKKDIIDSCNEINFFVADMDFLTFVKDTKTYSAVLMKISIIGEASTHFETEIKRKNSEIDWRNMNDMRNFLIHEYFEVDPKVVCNFKSVV